MAKKRKKLCAITHALQNHSMLSVSAKTKQKKFKARLACAVFITAILKFHKNVGALEI